MGRDLQFIVLNQDDSYAAELRAFLLGTGRIKIVAEVDEPALLGQAVRQFPVDVVLVHLDPTPEAILPVVAEVAPSVPDLAFFAVSSSTDGQLILRAMRTGMREFFPRPIDGVSFAEALDKIIVLKTDTGVRGKLITVIGAAGGVGATTLATNLAVELAQLSKAPVAVVDLDYRFGQVATFLDVEPTYTLADLCNSPEQLERAIIERALVKHQSGAYVLSRPASFAQADTLTAASCVGLLTSLLQFHEYVVADGPGRADLHARSILDISDVSLLVTQLLVPHIRNSLRMIEQMREAGFNTTRLRLLCNRVGGDAGNLSVEDVAGTLSIPVFAEIPDEWSTVSAAVNLGEPLLQHSPKSKTRLAIQEIARRLHAPEAGADEKEGRKKGLIGRIFAGSTA